MKKILFILSIFLINIISAHTGNDYYDHSMTTGDWVVGGVFLIVLIYLITLLINKYKK